MYLVPWPYSWLPHLSTVQYVTAQQEQEQARSTEDAEPNEGCTNEPGDVQEAWEVIVTLLLGWQAQDGKTQ